MTQRKDRCHSTLKPYRDLAVSAVVQMCSAFFLFQYLKICSSLVSLLVDNSWDSYFLLSNKMFVVDCVI